MPVGKEWNSGMGVQRGIMPRVVKKVSRSFLVGFGVGCWGWRLGGGGADESSGGLLWSLLGGYFRVVISPWMDAAGRGVG